MKIAVAGKGGVGKTSLTAWLGDYLARRGEKVWLVDADTAYSLGPALGLPENEMPVPLVQDKETIGERVGSSGMINLSPHVADLPEKLAADVAGMKLLVMGSIAAAGGGCACSANALLKALLAHLIMERGEWLLIDLEAGVEHLGRGTVEAVDALVVVCEPSLRSLRTGAAIASLARDMGLENQALVLNRAPKNMDDALRRQFEEFPGLPRHATSLPPLPGLEKRQLDSASVLELPERELLDACCATLLRALAPDSAKGPTPAST